MPAGCCRGPDEENVFARIESRLAQRGYTGLIVNETASSVTVRQPLGVEVVVARAQIATMQASKFSLMPEGLEEDLTEQDLADLVEFIFSK